jgi:protein required for attachment to host cells
MIMNAVPLNTWALVADGAKARLFRVGRKNGDFEELRQLESAARGAPSREISSDADSRSRHVAGVPGGHTKQPRTDPHDQAERQFAEQVMAFVGRSASTGAFNSLVVVADPRTLGTLRDCMPAAVAQRVSREMNLDLTWMPEKEIEARIRDEFELH